MDRADQLSPARASDRRRDSAAGRDAGAGCARRNLRRGGCRRSRHRRLSRHEVHAQQAAAPRRSHLCLQRARRTLPPAPLALEGHASAALGFQRRRPRQRRRTYDDTAPREIEEELGVSAAVEEIGALPACAGHRLGIRAPLPRAARRPLPLPPAEIERAASSPSSKSTAGPTPARRISPPASWNAGVFSGAKARASGLAILFDDPSALFVNGVYRSRGSRALHPSVLPRFRTICARVLTSQSPGRRSRVAPARKRPAISWAVSIDVNRPRNVDWKRAAALLYGDWGTSKAYVLGFAFGVAGFSSLPIILAVCALTGSRRAELPGDLPPLSRWRRRLFRGSRSRPAARGRRRAPARGRSYGHGCAQRLVGARATSIFRSSGPYRSVHDRRPRFSWSAVNWFGPKHSGSMAVVLSVPVVIVVVVI